MQAIRNVSGRAIPFGRKNVDTDVVIPAHWLKTITREGLGKGAFEAVRKEPGNVFENPDYAGAPILIAGDNFGCGSSREHAPWALLDFGIRCIIAPSFADIFYNNSFKNGILPIALPQAVVDQLMDDARKGANAKIAIDLAAQTITRPDGEVIHFDLDPFRKHCLLNGLDDIGLTMEKGERIDSYESRQRASQPWLQAAAR